ncbi:DUF2777 family protein [Alkalicoccus luteus]|uniref:DUF2777 family protein n=1 Tax=Alkalicoccus luteus TaxID=1237094 RepID=A0A969PSV0_9BACI|nr:DUF2777 family protein [Alkalicoccus luteus]NJP38880.1 DUF2777 family protein [Alkalicoccus luteus]
MNRMEASKNIGKIVSVDHGPAGKYAARLHDVTALPKKPWTGHIEILGVLEAPELDEKGTSLRPLMYEKNEKTDVPGRLIAPAGEHFNQSYSESYSSALKKMWDAAREQSLEAEQWMNSVHRELKQWRREDILEEQEYIYYVLRFKSKKMYLVDQRRGEEMLLEGCPFEFEVKKDQQWVRAVYAGRRSFRTTDEEILQAVEGTELRLAKDQFDPYQMLLRELDEASEKTLVHMLKQAGLTHDDCIYCHNSLLVQMLEHPGENDLNGVNFISFQDHTRQFMIQHHYRRKLHDDRADEVFDRFEITSDDGRRSISVYSSHAPA